MNVFSKSVFKPMNLIFVTDIPFIETLSSTKFHIPDCLPYGEITVNVDSTLLHWGLLYIYVRQKGSMWYMEPFCSTQDHNSVYFSWI